MADISYQQLMRILVPIQSLAAIVSKTVNGKVAYNHAWTQRQAAGMAWCVEKLIDDAIDDAQEREMVERVPIGDVHRLLSAYKPPKPRKRRTKAQ